MIHELHEMAGDLANATLDNRPIIFLNCAHCEIAI